MASTTRFATWRRAQKFSLRNLSDLSGYSPAMLSLVERGRRDMSPSAKVKLARALKVRVAVLFDVPSPDNGLPRKKHS